MKPNHHMIEMSSLDCEGLVEGEGSNQCGSKSLSPAQMESLVALCDTFLPQINLHCSNSNSTLPNPLLSFYQTSASMAGTPRRVEMLMKQRLEHPKLYLVGLTLWLLSNWVGTLILCGRGCLSTQFPYLHRFSRLPLQKRERILRSWSLSYFSLLRMFFLAIKFLTLLVFFTQLNDKDENVSWTAIGYAGPDPDFEIQRRRLKTWKQTPHNSPQNHHQHEDEDEDDVEEQQFGPLYKCLVNLKHPPQRFLQTLHKSGFSVSIPHGVLKRKLKASFVIKCDAVVVGSGSGGGVVAGVLAQAGYKVIVLEKGSYSARGNLSLLEGPTMERMYLGNGLLATDDLGVVVLSGSTVGGGSTVNWSASIRTPRHVLKEWSDRNELQLFDSRLYREAMDIVCERMGVQLDVDNEGFNNAVLRRGCNELGFPVQNIPRNSPPDHYCGWCCFGCKDGRKKGTAETWLVDLLKSGNGVILPECEAIEVLHKRKKGRERSTASGVAFQFLREGEREFCVVESKVTVVACGAIGTPPLLKRSHLKNPNIGQNLHLHPVTMAWGYFPDTVSSDTWPEAEKKSYEGGIMTAMSTVVGNFQSSGYGAVIQTPALHPGMFSVLMPWVSGVEIKRRMCQFSRTAHVFALARDKGSGKVLSPSSISYQMDKIDEENLRRGLEKVLRILAAAGAEEIGTHHGRGKSINVKQVSSHEFERFVKEESTRALRDLSTPICSAHQMGSCRMGVDPKSSAVNQMGETWEVEGLYVADTSVFPTALGVNPMVTVQSIAYCTAQSVLEALRRKKEKW